MTALKDELLQVIEQQRGVLFARPALVHRGMYAGRGVIADNAAFTADRVDSRGYLPVEWWIMSKTEARNAIPKEGEGVTAMVINKRDVPITELLTVAEEALFGSYAPTWPLTKILDIGGTERVPRYSLMGGEASPEVPPIPCHVHCGEVTDGKCGCGRGKTEAYFFPPLDVPPFNLKLGPVKTRLGLKPSTTREEVLKALELFGLYDDLYSLLNVFEVHPWETWHIEEKVIHAPGPWVTFEIQLPQDDYNLLAWQLGQPLTDPELRATKNAHQLKGLPHEGALVEGAINWEVNLAKDFKERWWHSCEVLSEGSWGKQIRLFYHSFYGEGYVIKPQQSFTRSADPRPYAGIAWSGLGTVNGQDLDSSVELKKEFLVIPNHSLEICNTVTSEELIVLTVFPLIGNTS